MYQKLRSDDVRFLRYAVQQTDGWTERWKKWHVEVGGPPKNIITTLQKLWSSSRNLRVGNKLPALFLKKLLCMGNYHPHAKWSLKGLYTAVFSWPCLDISAMVETTGSSNASSSNWWKNCESTSSFSYLGLPVFPKNMWQNHSCCPMIGEGTVLFIICLNP